MEKSKLIEVFFNYLNAYSYNDPIIALKFNHSLNVASYCFELANSLALNEKEKHYAYVLGLIHEIGSFENYVQNKTYQNTKLTLKKLFEQKAILLFDVPQEYYKVFKFAISQLTRYKIDTETISKISSRYKNTEVIYNQMLLFSQILADANIMEHYGMIKRKTLPPVNFDALTKTLSQKAKDSFESGQKIKIEDIESDDDQILYQISLYYDLNFDYSKKFVIKIDFCTAVMDFFKDEISLEEETLRQINFFKNNLLIIN